MLVLLFVYCMLCNSIHYICCFICLHCIMMYDRKAQIVFHDVMFLSFQACFHTTITRCRGYYYTNNDNNNRSFCLTKAHISNKTCWFLQL